MCGIMNIKMEATIVYWVLYQSLVRSRAACMVKLQEACTFEKALCEVPHRGM